MTEIVLLIIGVGLGGVLGVLFTRARSGAQIARLEATVAAARDGEARLEQSMRALTFEATVQSQDAVARAVAPLRDTLDRYERQIAELEHDRVDAYAQLRTQLTQVYDASTELRTQTGQLVAALRAPQIRGRWGEHQLRRIVEAAGLLEHCDFAEQVTLAADQGGQQRPDLVVRLFGGREVVVDAKAPLEAYLSAAATTEERAHGSHLAAHARAVRSHVDALSAKRYWAALEQAPEFVVLFVPADPFLDAALAQDPTLLEHAFARNVVLATPATLIALLRTVAFAWRQETLARDAVRVHQLGRELYSRLSTMTDHLSKVGSSLTGAVGAYNKAVGSLEARVLVSARRFAELGVAAEQITSPTQVELVPRVVTQPDASGPRLAQDRG